MKAKKYANDSQPSQSHVAHSGLITQNSLTLSIEECKKYLGKTNLTDEEIGELRDALCSLVDRVLDNYFDKLVQ